MILTGANAGITIYALLSPLLILQLGVFGMSVGIIISSITVKYRDLQVLVGFGVQLFMYLSPVVYSVSAIENQTLKTLISLNPVTPIIEFMRKGFINAGSTPWIYLAISFGVTAVLAFFSVVIFNAAERNFIDKI